MAEMNSRQRVFTTIGHREPDRVPLYAFDMDHKFINALGNGNPLKALEALGLDSFPIRIQYWCQEVPTHPSLSIDILDEQQTTGGGHAAWNGIDEFGRIWKKGSYIGGALKTHKDIGRYIPPLKPKERISPEVMQRYKDLYPDKAYCVNSHLGPFGLTIESMGFEHFCYSLYDDRDLVKSILDGRTQWFIEVCQYVESLGADFLVMGDDVAFKQKTFVSPKDFKELAIPCYERIVESLSMPVFWHSEGYIEPLMDLAIEAGIKGLHAIEPLAGNDLGRIKQKYGDKLILLGNVDCIEVLTRDDLEVVRRDVDRCMAAAKAGGGFMLSSASFHGQCKLEAIVEMLRYAKKVGRY